MARTEYEPGKNLGEEIKGLGRQAVFDLVLEVCRVIRSEAGDRYRGGVYPENLDYLREHYQLSYNEEKYHVFYEPLASNLMPSIKVAEWGGKMDK